MFLPFRDTKSHSPTVAKLLKPTVATGWGWGSCQLRNTNLLSTDPLPTVMLPFFQLIQYVVKLLQSRGNLLAALTIAVPPTFNQNLIYSGFDAETS